MDEPRREEHPPRTARRRLFAGWNIEPLTVRLAAGIGLLVLVPLGVGFYALSDHHFDQTVATQRRATQLHARILETALLHQMMEQDTTLMTDILEELGHQPSVRSAMILNHEGEIRIASDPSLVGQTVSQDSPSCIVCHAQQPIDRAQWTVLGEGEEEVLRTVHPIANRPRCHSCHPPETGINGILILDTSLAELHAELREDVRLFVAGAAGLGLLLVGGIGLFVRRLVLVRLGWLGRTARAIAAGDLRERAATTGRDVISSLAGDFNHMADTVSALVTEVRAQEAQLVNIVDSLDDGLVVLDGEARLVAANRAFRERVGVSAGPLHQGTCRTGPMRRLPCCRNGAECPAERCRTLGTVQREVYCSTPEGGAVERFDEVLASPVFDETGNVVEVVEIWRDITQRVEEERHLAEIEHLVALGTLASGFSHEVNTPLASILTSAESALGRIDDLEPGDDPAVSVIPALRDSATVIRDQVMRCRKITEQFLRFSRGIPPSIEPIDLPEVVGSVVGLVRETAREQDVTIEVAGAGPLPGLRANAEVVQHALLNLLVNAIQSCEGKPGHVRIAIEADESSVRVLVSDDGCGIEPALRQRLFQPFHSRKRGGTGLGLFLSRSFMRRFDGDVRLVSSAVGEGSCFVVSFATVRGGTR